MRQLTLFSANSSADATGDVILHVDGAYAHVVRASPRLEAYLHSLLSYQDRSLIFNRRYYGPTSFSCYDRTKKQFWAGLVPHVVQNLSEQGYQCNVKHLIDQVQPEITDLPDWLYAHQIEAIQTMWANSRGIISAPTGSGKTIAVAYYVRGFPSSKILVTVPTATLMDKTVDELHKVLNQPIGQVGDGRADWQRVTVGLVRSLIKYQAELQSVDICVRDEAHGSSCESHARLAALMPNLKASWGVTATPWRSDGKDMVMYGVLGPLRYAVTPEELKTRRVILQPTYYQVPVDCPQVPAKGNKPPVDVVYDKSLVHNDLRNELIVELALAYLNSAHRAGPLLILVKQIDHGHIIQHKFQQHGAAIPFAHGGTPQDERLVFLDQLRANQLPALIASSIFNEGEDIKPLSVLIIASGGGNQRIFTQQVGRVLRTSPGKTKALVIDFADQEAHYLKFHSRKRLNFLNALYPNCGLVVTKERVLKELVNF